MVSDFNRFADLQNQSFLQLKSFSGQMALIDKNKTALLFPNKNNRRRKLNLPRIYFAISSHIDPQTVSIFFITINRLIYHIIYIIWYLFLGKCLPAHFISIYLFLILFIISCTSLNFSIDEKTHSQ